MTSSRHSWGEPVRFSHKTERECRRCGMVKVTRHEADGPRDVHWIEWWRDEDQIASDRTPPCDARCEVPA
jgi:hypothetical protein